MPAQLFNISLLLTASSLFLWPIPGTIAARNVVLGLLLISVLATSRMWWKESAYWDSLPKGPLTIFAILTGWITLVIIGWAVEPELSLKELWSQWTLPAACGGAGVILALNAIRLGPSAVTRLIATVFYTFFAIILLHDAADLFFFIETGQVPFRQAPVLYLPELAKAWMQGHSGLELYVGVHGEKFSFVNNAFAAFVFAELLQRLLKRTRWLPISNLGLAAAGGALLLCSYWLRYRNGNIGLLAMLCAAFLLIVINLRKEIGFPKLMLGTLIGILLVAGLTSALWKSDPRWQRFVETVPLAWDTQSHKAWISSRFEAYPLLSNGQPVDDSAYDRIAWIKEGSKLALEHPLGTGLNRSAFFDGLDRKLQMQGALRGGHSHSGVVDFAIANGFPGLLLWFAFLASMAWLGWQAFRSGQVGLGLLVMFLVSGFFTRSWFDSNIRDHVLQQFLFMVALFVVLANKSMRRNT